jgi:hypothetical protein
MVPQHLAQSVQGDTVPFVTVSTDDRGGACWVVVGLGQQVRCCSGRRALAVLAEMLASRGLSVPQ